MGSAQAKDITVSNQNTIQTPIGKGKAKHLEYVASPVLARAIAASFDTDPRSPGSRRRTPVHSPMSTPPLSRKPYRERVLERVAAGSQFDPRSPSAKRTPLHLANSDHKAAPSPFLLGAPRSPYPFRDPRSPQAMRTPLALSTVDAIVVPDDISIEGEKLVFAEVVVDQPVESITTAAEKDEEVKEVLVVCSTTAESTSTGFVTETFSPDTPSAALRALAGSPMYSPMLSRKRKDSLASLSPLKKSYSAPDENAAPSSPVLHKSVNHLSKPRTPLSPLSMNVRPSCMSVQPIKFRMDPGILG